MWHFFQSPNINVSYAPSGSSTLGNKYTYWLDVSLEDWNLPSTLSLIGIPTAVKAEFSINGKQLSDGTKLYANNYYTFHCDSVCNSQNNIFMPIHDFNQTKVYLLYGMGFVTVQETKTVRIGIGVFLWSMDEIAFKNVPQPDLCLREINIYY
ncbi:MAG: hypothetical protein ACI35P_10135 [Bacillus sp. (in: firmicutes)]